MAKNQFLPPKVRRPREEMRQAVQQLEVAMGFYVVGSWRREKETIGDLDILVPPHIDFGEAVVTCQDLLGYEPIRTGAMKSEGITDYRGEPLLLNLWRVPSPYAYGGMFLFATGPFDLNIMMRGKAKGRGWTLSQYGLFMPAINEGDDDIQIDKGFDGVVTEKAVQVLEKDIFDKLGVQYLSPKDRENWRQHLLEKKETKTGSFVNVKSSDGVGEYQVTLENGKAVECECKGFSYRNKCRHLVIAETMHRTGSHG